MRTKCASPLRQFANVPSVAGAITIYLLFAPEIPAATTGPLAGKDAIEHLKVTGQYESLVTAMNGARHGLQPVQSPEGSAGTIVQSSTKGSQTEPLFAQQAHLKASNAGRLDQFGWSVAISGDTAVVGAPYEDSSATGINGFEGDHSPGESGAAYVFVRNGSTWSQQAYLKASNSGEDDYFGAAVSVSGDTVVVGAPGEDSGGTGVDGNQGNSLSLGSDSGAAYVFVRSGTTWSQQADLKAGSAWPGKGFGSTVSASGDTLVVGAPGESSNATGVNGDQSDTSASGAGAAYVFVRSGTTWSQQAYLKASNTEASDSFGRDVSVFGDTIVVGSPLEDSNATGLNGDQNNNSATNAGAAYVFVRSGTTWSQQAYLKGSNTDEFDLFGRDVSVSGDTVVVVGKSGAYVFVQSGTTWSQQTYLDSVNQEGVDGFWSDAALSGDTLVVGAESNDGNLINSGAAYVFMRSGTTWIQKDYLKASNPGSLYEFGRQVAVSGDTVLVGANKEGISDSPKPPSLLWTVGKDDNSWPIGNGGGANATYVQENGRANTLPGNPANREVNQQADDDYYFAGVYSTVIAGNGSYVPVGTVAANEEAAERGFFITDNNLRYHFNLPTTLIDSDPISVAFSAKDLDLGNPDPRYGVEVYFNGVKVQSQVIIRPDHLNAEIITEPFSLANVNAQTGPGFDNIVWLKGIKHNTQGGGNYMTIDYVKLHSWGRQTNDFGAAYIFSLPAFLPPIGTVTFTPTGLQLTMPVGVGQNVGVEYSETLNLGS